MHTLAIRLRFLPHRWWVANLLTWANRLNQSHQKRFRRVRQILPSILPPKISLRCHAARQITSQEFAKIFDGRMEEMPAQ
jgi:hypothetical protein